MTEFWYIVTEDEGFLDPEHGIYSSLEAAQKAADALNEKDWQELKSYMKERYNQAKDRYGATRAEHEALVYMGLRKADDPIYGKPPEWENGYEPKRVDYYHASEIPIKVVE